MKIDVKKNENRFKTEIISREKYTFEPMYTVKHFFFNSTLTGPNTLWKVLKIYLLHVELTLYFYCVIVYCVFLQYVGVWQVTFCSG